MNKYQNIQENNIETIKITLNENLPSPTMIQNKKINSFGNHKAILGYLNAYFNHCPIKLSPNLLWQLILNNFSKYVNDNSKSLRKKFVDFEDKKNLICVIVGTLKDIDKYKESIIKQFCDKIEENVGKELIDILTPNFTSSTNDTIIAGKASIMATFKKYFSYELNMISCGIPYILLEGNLSDWEKILEKLRYLSKYEFYIKLMEEDIIEIINTKKGKINLNFWRNIIMETKEKTKEREGCCSFTRELERDFITGWILHFYNEKKIKKDKLKDIIGEIVNAPLTIKDIMTGEMKGGIIQAGIIDLKQDPNNFIVEPIVNYSLSIIDDIKDMKYFY